MLPIVAACPGSTLNTQPLQSLGGVSQDTHINIHEQDVYPAVYQMSLSTVMSQFKYHKPSSLTGVCVYTRTHTLSYLSQVSTLSIRYQGQQEAVKGF